MRRSDTTDFLRATALAVVLLCAGAGVGSASCGDYLRVLPPDSPSPAKPCPCLNGECQPPIPMPASGEPTTTELSRSADVLFVLNPGLPDPAAHGWPSDSSARPHRTSSGVFHPPRG